MEARYLPVHPDYYEIIEEAILKKSTASIHYFESGTTLRNAKGRIKEITVKPKQGEFVSLENGKKIRLDRIIVFNGKPGPAFDEYDSYALACLDCTGGMV